MNFNDLTLFPFTLLGTLNVPEIVIVVVPVTLYPRAPDSAALLAPKFALTVVATDLFWLIFNTTPRPPIAVASPLDPVASDPPRTF